MMAAATLTPLMHISRDGPIEGRNCAADEQLAV
jgi:hypothetical protein